MMVLAISSSHCQSVQLWLSFLFWTCFLWSNHVCDGSDGGIDGRHSFSLTTFDPSGKLGQVERAAIAASLGTPIVAVCCRPSRRNSRRNSRHQKGTILMAAPQVLSSPLVKDDGTARFSMISSQIAVAHSGISADGRALVAAAQRLAVEHAYTFNEPIPIEIFLEEVSLLFQEYTMKPGARPFGVTLLVAYVPSCIDDDDDDDDDNNNEDDDEGAQPRLYRIDPSGAVSSLGSHAIINGHKLFNDESVAKLKEIANSNSNDDDDDENSDTTNVKQDESRLTEILANAIRKASSISPPTLSNDEGSESSSASSPTFVPTVMKIISASLGEDRGLVVQRHDGGKVVSL